jgi:hypothetical protein
MTATYILSTPNAYVNEGDTITVNLNTTNVADGTRVPFAITGTGISSQDFLGNPSLIGNFVVFGGLASVSFVAKNDLLTEYDETLLLTLTGTGNYESINVTIQDTSKTVVTSIVNFSINATPSVIREGQYANFNLTASGLTPGTVVPYRLLGVSQDRLGYGNVTGLLTFVSSNVVGVTSANISFPILQDQKTQGDSTAVLLLSPEFSYSLVVSGTVTIKDTSVAIIPTLTLTTNKGDVKEGESVTITLTTYNIPNGVVYPYQIIPYPTERYPQVVDISRFNGIASLKGNFPATSGNTTSITLSIRDNFIFDQPTYFYIGIPDETVTSPLIRILDSGNTFLASSGAYSGNAYISFLDKADLVSNIGSITIKNGYWKDTSGQLSESIFLQGRTPFAPEGSAAYYQPFSYVIRSSKSIEEWGSAIKTMLHPAGLSIFSEINNETLPSNTPKIVTAATNDAEIQTFAVITADISKLDASEISTPTITALKVDAVSALYNI